MSTGHMYRTGATKTPADHVRDVTTPLAVITTRASSSYWGCDDAGRWHTLRLARPTGFGPVTRCGRFLPTDAKVTTTAPPATDECAACTRERATARLAADELATMRTVLQERRPE